jgi:hypothetical protein
VLLYRSTLHRPNLLIMNRDPASGVTWNANWGCRAVLRGTVVDSHAESKSLGQSERTPAMACSRWSGPPREKQPDIDAFSTFPAVEAVPERRVVPLAAQPPEKQRLAQDRIAPPNRAVFPGWL